MTKAKQVLASLTEEQKQFYQQKTISDTRKIKDWIWFFTGISLLDRLGDKKRSVLKGWGFLSLFLALVFIVLAITLDEPFYFIGLGAFIVTTILFFYKMYQLKGDDVSNYLRLFFLPILKVLTDKAGAESKLAATLDFKDARDRNPMKNTLRNGRNQTRYAPTYILARVQLLDGAKLQFGLQEEIKDLNWSQRNSRGKTKYKSKTKTTHLLLIKMSIPKSNYEWNGTSFEDLVIKEKNYHYEVRKKLKLKALGDHFLPVDVFFKAISSIYAQFTPLEGGEQRKHPREGDAGEYIEDDGVYIAPYVWYGGYFDDYDYDSVDYHDGTDMAYDDDENSVFDS